MGEKHKQTFADLEQQFSHVGAEHLVGLCRQLQKSRANQGTGTVTGTVTTAFGFLSLS
jgi:hypothetical protein